MTQIKIKKARVFPSGEQFFPITHTKAVIDDNGYTVESRMQAVQDVVNQAQMQIGSVPSDLAPTEDSTNWVTSGGVYNAIQVLSGDLNQLIQPTKTLSYTDLFTEVSSSTGYITSSGGSNSTSGWKKTDFLEVAPNTTVTWSGLTSHNLVYNVYFYDSSKTAISNSWKKASSGSVTSPSNAAFVRFSGSSSDTPSASFSQLDGEGLYEKLSILDSHEERITTLESEIRVIENIDMTYKLTDGFSQTGWIKAADGTITSTGGYRTTEYIPIDSGVKIAFSGFTYHNQVANVSFYTEKSRSSIISSATIKAASSASVTIPENAVYVRFSTEYKQTESIIFAYDNGLVSDYALSLNAAVETLQLSKPAEPKSFVQLYKDSMTELSTTDWTIGGTWTQDTNGSTPSSVGTSTYLKLKKRYNSDKRFMRVGVVLGVDTILNINCADTSITSSDGGSAFAIDMANEKLIIYNGLSSTEIATTALPASMLTAGDYVVEISKNVFLAKLTLYNTLTCESISVEYDGWAAGRENACYYFYCSAGTLPTLHDIEVRSAYEPDVIFVGDSITEGYGVTDKSLRYAELYRQNHPEQVVVISAMGGDTIDGVLAKFDSEFNLSKPKVMSVMIGANHSASPNTPEKLNQLKANCDAIGCTLVLNHRPAKNENSYITDNIMIDAIGVPGAKFDVATSIDNIVGNGRNTALYYDSTHPKDNGQIEMYKRLAVDVPEFMR